MCQSLNKYSQYWGKEMRGRDEYSEVGRGGEKIKGKRNFCNIILLIFNDRYYIWSFVAVDTRLLIIEYMITFTWHPTPVLLPGKSHGRRSLVGCSPWGLEELDTTERLHFHFSLSCIGEGNGNPFQCSCLENPRDGRAWWAAVYGVTQSRTQLKQLSSSSSRVTKTELFTFSCIHNIYRYQYIVSF